MARKIRSTQLKQQLIENATAELKDKERARHLYNFLYRRGRFFKFSVSMRLVTIIFSTYLIYFNYTIIGVEKEVVMHYDVEETHLTKRTDAREHKSIYLTTAFNKYVIDLLKSEPDKFAEKDTILVSRTIFGKKTYVSKPGSQNLNILVELARCNNYLIFVAGFSLLSFMLKDGYDLYSRVIMRCVLLFDLFGILFYFIS